MAKTVVFDFDGVIHSYTSGWLGETTIPDPPVPGIREALKEIHGAGYEVVVVSTRCATAKGKGAIEAWLYNNGLREYIDKVCKEKPPAIAYIDDRAICFDGHSENLLKKIQSFEPWYKIPTLAPQNEPLTIEELQEMDREPVYIISEFYHISEWNIPNGIGEIVIAYDVPCAGMKEVIPSVEFIDGKNLSVEKYGSDWVAYRRPPEGDEDAHEMP